MEEKKQINQEVVEEKSTKWNYFYWGLILFLVIQIFFFLWITNSFNNLSN